MPGTQARNTAVMTYDQDQPITKSSSYKSVAAGGGGSGEFTVYFATKRWVDGPVTDHQQAPLLLMQDGVAMSPQPAPTVTGSGSVYNYFWPSLPVHRPGTQEKYVYSVTEDNVNNGSYVAPSLNHYQVSINGSVVTNTYEPPMKRAWLTKDFYDNTGTPAVPQPMVKLVLQRSIDGTTWEDAPDQTGQPLSMTTNVNASNRDDRLRTAFANQDGIPYRFQVREEFVNPQVTDDNWLFSGGSFVINDLTQAISMSGLGFTNINTLVSGDHKGAQLKITKVIDNAGLPGGSKNDVTQKPLAFQVKVTGPYGYENTVNVYPGKTTELNNLYYGEYQVTEIGPAGFEASYEPADGKVTLRRPDYFMESPPVPITSATVTITNKPTDLVEVTATKVWSGGPVSDRTATSAVIGLYQDGVKIGDSQGSATSPPLSVNPTQDGAAEYTYRFSQLPKYDENGFPYVYTVKEENTTTQEENGVTKTLMVVNHNDYLVTQEGMRITNTYQPPMRRAWLSKEFLGNDADPAIPQPMVKLTLERSADGGATWEDALDQLGNPFTYSTDVDGDNRGNKLRTAFANQDGQVYRFRVREEFVNPQVTDDNWLFNGGSFVLRDLTQAVSMSGLGFTNINTLVSGDHKGAQLKITKALNNSGLTGDGGTGDSAGERLAFQVKVTGPNNYEETITIHPGETVELNNLYYGEYQVTELEPGNYQVSYQPLDGKVTLRRPDYFLESPPVPTTTATVTITNAPKLGTDAVGELTAIKKWVGGKTSDRWAGGVTITLYQNGTAIASNDAYPADELVITPTQKGQAQYNYHWVKLALYDENGYPFDYTVDETSFPDGYIKSVSADGLTFTNTFPETPVVDPGDLSYDPIRVPLIAHKTLKNGSLKAGAFTFQLKDATGKVIAEATNGGDGSVVFPDRTFSRVVSNYLYTISEVKGEDKRITYDQTVYTVQVSTTAQNGQLTAKVDLQKNGVPYQGNLVFANVRKAPATGDSTLLTILLLSSLSMVMLLGFVAIQRQARGKSGR